MPSIPEEPLLAPNPDRFCMFPIQYPQIWEMYKKAEASFWTAEEVDLSDDKRHWDSLTDGERHFITHVLAFFAASDGIVLENLAGRFMKEVQIAEARAFYGFQIAIENIHSEMYSLLLESYIKDSNEKNRLFRAIENDPLHREESKMGPEMDRRKLLRDLLAEKAGADARPDILKRVDFKRRRSCEGYVEDAVNIEREFVCEALPCGLVGMNGGLMSQYIEYVADRLLVALGHGEDQFFEKRVGEYQKASVMSNLNANANGDHHVFKIDEDF
ncbi:hypothetical protein E3N88_43590 [Mikania micrantha]|uniref:Uncharacterized protein n=1 Tax=Mikania micrantha TaxID=192012 RepID=A0A5N6LGQ1_9ASTR|nr:hypothetical protein E3N88_43590 [Mikania micrantha]